MEIMNRAHIDSHGGLGFKIDGIVWKFTLLEAHVVF